MSTEGETPPDRIGPSEGTERQPDLQSCRWHPRQERILPDWGFIVPGPWTEDVRMANDIYFVRNVRYVIERFMGPDAAAKTHWLTYMFLRSDIDQAAAQGDQERLRSSSFLLKLFSAMLNDNLRYPTLVRDRHN